MLNLYQYHTEPQSIKGAPTDPVLVGEYNGKQYFLAPVTFEKNLNWNDAIEYCRSLSVGGYNDWRLPNNDELNFIYQNKSNKLMLADAYYWSSSENSANSAWFQNVSNGNQYNYGKNIVGRVRAVRST
jgi:hypothetical protein